MSVKKPKVDFTSGNVFSKLLLFSLPIIATNVLQVLYNAADLMVISLSTEPNGVGAVGFSATPVGLIINLFIGFSLGSNVIIARNIGAKDKEGTERAIHTALTLALIFGIGSSILGLIVSRPLLIIMGAPEVLLDLAVTYMSIYFLGVPFVALTNFLISIFRAKGDSKTPLIVLSITGLVNVTLNLIFVLVFNLSAEGVALATAIANAVSCVVLLIKLRKCDDYTGFRFKKLCLNKRMARDILYVGFPSAIQGSFISITNMVITSSISVLDLKLSPDPLLTPVINGNAAQGNLDGFVYTAMDAITAGVISFTGQNFGAKQPDRIKRGVYWGTLQVSLVGLFSAILIYIFRAPLLSLYGVVNGAPGSADALAFNVSTVRIYFLTLPYFICGIMNVMTGVLKGLGKPIPSFLITFFGLCVLRILWSVIIFPMDETLETLFVGYPITWIVSSIVGASLVLYYIKKLKAVTKIK